MRARSWANSLTPCTPTPSVQPPQGEIAHTSGAATGTGAQDAQHRSEALKALRSALVSRIYLSIWPCARPHRAGYAGRVPFERAVSGAGYLAASRKGNVTSRG